jgi:ketosteroid isomerase-like protein
MSQENVEIVRMWFAALRQGDLAPELWDPHLQIDNVPEFPITGPYRGPEGLQRWWEELSEVVENARIELDEAVGLGDERVLTVQRLVGDFTKTRIPVDQRWAAVFLVRDEKIIRVSGYASRRQAREAAGLPPEGG